MSEYIKKEDALNAIRKSSHYGRTQKIYVCHREVVDSIDDLPTYSLPDSAENKPEHEKLMDEINENREKEVVIVPTENKGDLISREWLLKQPLDTSNYPSNYVKLAPSVDNKGDLISRQAVLDELEKWDWQELYLPIHFKQILDDVPSADVRPNIHGHWIKINSGDEDFPESIVCDRCNHENSHLDFNEHNEPIGKVFVTSNFCPNCGAKMTWVGAIHEPYKKGE